MLSNPTRNAGRVVISCVFSWVFFSSGPGVAQVSVGSGTSGSVNLVVPQCRAYGWAAAATPIQITGVDAKVVITEQVAVTQLDIHVLNSGVQQEMAEVLVPVPEGAVIRTLQMDGTGATGAARLLERDEARRTFKDLVARIKDPALLEFEGLHAVRSSVFPVPAGGQQTVRLVYEHLATVVGDRGDFWIPRSDLVANRVPWRISVRIEAKRTIQTVYSPSHPIEARRASPQRFDVTVPESAQTTPGTFRISWLYESGPVTASLMTHPDRDGRGGYFLLLAGLTPVEAAGAADRPEIPRELTLVLDRSGSMRGEKIEQAREAALQVLAGLRPGESFQLVVYNDTIQTLAAEPQLVTRESIAEASKFVEQITAQGGTNLHDALATALRPKPAEGRLPIVLFLTDGLPTVGITDEGAIRKLAQEANPFQRRVFTFGVGVDVNTPLLDKVSRQSRAYATLVLPGENVEAKVGRVFRGLSGPVLAAPKLTALDSQGRPTALRVSDMLPAELPDLFQGDQLVVLGRYQGHDPLEFRLEGNHRGQPREFSFRFEIRDPDPAHHPSQAYVARLWASRRIGQLTDWIRDMGGATSTAPDNPRLKELTEEIVRLSTEFGILTEYTAFLAEEGVDLSRRDALVAQTAGNYRERAISVRSGTAAANQDLNNAVQRGLACANLTNCYLDANLNRVEITRVQQVADHAFYDQGRRWVDSHLTNRGAETVPDEVIVFGSPEFLELAERLVRERRQQSLALPGDVLIEVDGRAVLVKGVSAEQ